MRAEVQAKLELEWSPEQIANHLRTAFPDRPTWHVCHKTTYQAIYHGGKGGLSRSLTRKLRTGRSMRKQRRRPDERRSRFVEPAQLVDHRPPVVCTRTRIGDWEGDLIVGRGNQSAIATLVDRTSRYLKLVHLPVDRSAGTVRDALIASFGGLPADVRLTLTWDQGSELAPGNPGPTAVHSAGRRRSPNGRDPCVPRRHPMTTAPASASPARDTRTRPTARPASPRPALRRQLPAQTSNTPPPAARASHRTTLRLNTHGASTQSRRPRERSARIRGSR
ncbi:IS30 family transposase [Amycolatopsis sp. cmx-8-4]|uniref:IS30 family transposase n=1 Tax=Amycolatopsis sp. cmx-8-4 TaxID=2790947 RepID=UPI003978C5A4